MSDKEELCALRASSDLYTLIGVHALDSLLPTKGCAYIHILGLEGYRKLTKVDSSNVVIQHIIRGKFFCSTTRLDGVVQTTLAMSCILMDVEVLNPASALRAVV